MNLYRLRFFLLALYISNACNALCLSNDLQADDDLWETKGLTTLKIETKDHEEPTYERVDAPEGASGIGIKNATPVPGRMVMIEHGDTIYDSGNEGMSVRIRGNTSATLFKKKPYKIKLEKKADLLGGGKSKHYVLIRDENLKSLIGFKTSELLELEWTPKWKYVKVVMNGIYRGVYLMCEQVKAEKNKVKVNEDGFFFELDAYWWNEPQYITSAYYKLNYTFKYPEILSESDSLYIADILGEMEKSLMGDYTSDYIDKESFARWCLAQDIMGNEDWQGANIYFKIESREEPVVTMPVLWDFNQIMQVNDNFAKIHNQCVFYHLFKDDEFYLIYKELWNQYGGGIFDDLSSMLDEFADSEMKDAFNELVAIDNTLYEKSYLDVDSYVNQYKEMLFDKKMFMTNTLGVPVIPTGMSGTSVKNNPHFVKSDYYNLNGQKVDASVVRTSNGVYIKDGKKFIR